MDEGCPIREVQNELSAARANENRGGVFIFERTPAMLLEERGGGDTRTGMTQARIVFGGRQIEHEMVLLTDDFQPNSKMIVAGSQIEQKRKALEGDTDLNGAILRGNIGKLLTGSGNIAPSLPLGYPVLLLT